VSDADLPDTLEYSGEFGPELVLFLPFVRWLARTGRLGTRTVLTYRGMAPFYAGLGIAALLEKDAPREWVPPDRRPRWLPVRNEHDFDGRGRPDAHDYGDMRATFAATPLPDALVAELGDKPLLIVHNKVADEWGLGPINFIPLGVLETLFATLADAFTIVYIRHGKRALSATFSQDHNQVRDFDDAALLAKFPRVLDFDDLFDRHGEAFGGAINLFKARLYAVCYHFMTSQGGGAAQIAQYSGSLIAIMHRKGQEQRWAYAPGYYQFMAEPPPTLLLCASGRELKSTFAAFKRSIFDERRVVLAPEDSGLAVTLSIDDIAKRGARTMRGVRLRESLRKLFRSARVS